jgi:hypothetical protein
MALPLLCPTAGGKLGFARSEIKSVDVYNYKTTGLTRNAFTDAHRSTGPEPTLSKSHLKARFFIDLQPEHVRTRVVPDHIQVELPFGDLARI